MAGAKLDITGIEWALAVGGPGCVDNGSEAVAVISDHHVKWLAKLRTLATSKEQGVGVTC